ncbi:hypothetical protein Goklo_014817, partial [Gossypium klotzschianum]|nr:hypothetical protein [Gossypium klotzschianum]
FAIGSAALVSLALFGAYVSRAGIKTVDVLTPKAFIGLIVGAMLPYWQGKARLRKLRQDINRCLTPRNDPTRRTRYAYSTYSRNPFRSRNSRRCPRLPSQLQTQEEHGIMPRNTLR